jgi:hypothetical protein
MRTSILTIGLILASLCLPGCIAINAEKRTCATPSGTIEPEAMAIKEIDAAGKLSNQNARQEFYTNYAGRTDLGPQAQVHLVEAVFKRLSSENAKMAVLEALIANPSFSTAAKSAILDRLGRLSIDSHRTKILERLSRR